MHKYEVNRGQTLNILTPFNIKFTDIKTETVVKNDSVILKSEYPNGLYIEITQYNDKIILLSNRELIDNGDGTFTAPAQ
ncbi:hypothetical protein DFR55_10989 [Herbinix hemicellulosilytica]|uniref:Uncharacterized protein n=1 Tax=Herbinix hemicellulosilytica TaxID=1564487 RepID=A0A0H5SHF8_HERHM|nr:hypothetical protein [Herbinix hemicellulosilytica]RBP58874.1 hypothetical protein DFR55_10989 [Herbinix hemicellulosilytica]CRZ34919.1 hypothetical protein HHT355_1719 [Herbinix hemicellulosilytica]